jgi:hypothetical protein
MYRRGSEATAQNLEHLVEERVRGAPNALKALDMDTIKTILVGPWAAATAACEVNGLQLLPTRIGFFEASEQDALLSTTWLTAHVPIALFCGAGPAPRSLHPRAALTLGTHTLPNVSSKVWEVGLAETPTSWDSKLFAKVLPKRCRIRDMITFMREYMDSAPYRSRLIKQALLCTLLGLYPSTSSGPGPSFETIKNLYVWLYLCPERAEISNQQVCTLVVRELLVHIVTQHPALECVMRRLLDWDAFTGQIREAVHTVRTNFGTGWIHACDALAAYTSRAPAVRYNQTIAESTAMRRLLTALTDALDDLHTDCIEAEMKFVRLASESNIVGILNRVRFCGQYTNCEYRLMQTLLQCTQCNEGIGAMNKAAGELSMLSSSAGSLLARLAIETFIVARTADTYAVDVPWGQEQRQKLQQKWQNAGDIKDMPQAAAFIFCSSCTKVACRYVPSGPSDCHTATAHGSNSVDVDPETFTLRCSHRAKGTGGQRRKAIRFITGALCSAQAVVAVPLIGKILFFNEKSYGVCVSCGHMMQNHDLRYGSSTCAQCVVQTHTRDTRLCTICRKNTKLSCLGIWYVKNDLSPQTPVTWNICQPCNACLSPRNYAAIDLSAWQLEECRQARARAALQLELHAHLNTRKNR